MAAAVMAAGADDAALAGRVSRMRDNLEQSMHQQVLQGDDALAERLRGEIDRMSRQLEQLNASGAAPAAGETGRSKRTGRLDHDVSGLYERSSSVAEPPPRRKRRPPQRPDSLPELAAPKGVSAATVRRQARKAARPSKTERAAAEKKKREEVKARRLAANQPAKKADDFAEPRRKPRPLKVPVSCEAEDGLIMRNIREQWKNIGYAIKSMDQQAHMHDDRVSKFGNTTGFLRPQQIRKLLARFAITFSDSYFGLLTSLIDPEPNGEIDYRAFLGLFAKGSRHEDTHAIKPMEGISLNQAKVMVREMIENKLPVGPAPLKRCFQFFDGDGSGSIDIDEFKHALHMKANLAFAPALLNRLMADYDDDKSGAINFRKFCENVMDSKVGQADCVTKVKPKGLKNVVSSDAGTSDHFIKRKIQMEKKNLRLAFRAADGSGQGVVPVDQLRGLLNRYDIHMTDDQFVKLVAQMDADGSGDVSYQEFLDYFARDLDATTVLKPIGGITVKQAQRMVQENLMSKLPSGPAPLRRCWAQFDGDGSGEIDLEEMRHAFLMKANLVFEEGLLGRMMKDYDDDNTGVIDYRKFCENVMGSHPDDAGGWGSSSSGSNARIPGADKAKKRYEEKKRKKEARRKAKAPSDHPLGGGDEGTGLDLMGTGLSIASQSMQLQAKDAVHVRRHPLASCFRLRKPANFVVVRFAQRRQPHVRGSPGYATATGGPARV